jgi:hypothetical protein
MLTELQEGRWRQIKQEADADAAWLGRCQEGDAKRVKVRSEILDYLKRYLSGTVSTEDFRATFDRRTRKEWTSFGLKGMSGAMFLNKLVKHIPDATELTEQLPGQSHLICRRNQ